MPRDIQVAAIQMDASPAPTAKRLARAEMLVREAAITGAQIIVLPELFNTGYMYDAENFALAEEANGETATWMRTLAAELNIYLAGTLMLREGADVYNAMLLWSPHGDAWRYDKNYPWAWERGYFRGRRNITIAHTPLGKIGMLICWDAAHRQLWRDYAGRVDLMLISSCPPNITDPMYVMRDGSVITSDDMQGLAKIDRHEATNLFGAMINQQVQWLGVPCVATVACGSVTTRIPESKLLWRMMALTAPKMRPLVKYADVVHLECRMVEGCKVINADGTIASDLMPDDGETWTSATIHIADTTPRPRKSQPASLVSRKSYLLSDRILPWLMVKTYKKGTRT